MKLFAAILIIVFVAFSGYHLSFRKIRLPLFTRAIYITGIEYLFLGFLLGPQILNLFDTRTLSSLEPLSALLLGWVGLLCGFQCEIKNIRRFSRSYFISSILEIFVTFIIFFTGFYFCLPYCLVLSDGNRFLISLGFAAIATNSSQTGLALLTSEVLKKRSYLVNYLRYLSSMSAIGAFALYSTLFLIKSPIILHSASGASKAYSLLSVIVANTALIVLYNLFFSNRKEKKELSVLLIGMVIITSGAASALQFSPLLANFVMGVIIVNTRREKERLFNLLIWAEKPLYLLLLVFLGACWNPTVHPGIPMAATFISLRFISKLTAGFFASRIRQPALSVPGNLGLGLLEQGGVPLAIFFDLNQVFPSSVINTLIGGAIMGLIINDIASPYLMDKMVNPKHRDPEEPALGHTDA